MRISSKMTPGLLALTLIISRGRSQPLAQVDLASVPEAHDGLAGLAIQGIQSNLR